MDDLIRHRVLFHYNNDLADITDNSVEPGELTYHEHLKMEDGKPCTVWLPSDVYPGDHLVRAYEAVFDDGNELDIWLNEMEKIEEE